MSAARKKKQKVVFADGRIKVNPTTTKRRLEQIKKKKGTITPELVVDDARDPLSPLHDHFEWDDGEAAHKYRLSQAGFLIRSFRIHLVEGKKTTERRAFVHVRTKDLNEYQPIEEAMSDDEVRDVTLRRALKYLISFRARYQDLDELASLFTEIDRVVQGYDLTG